MPAMAGSTACSMHMFQVIAYSRLSSTEWSRVSARAREWIFSPLSCKDTLSSGAAKHERVRPYFRTGALELIVSWGMWGVRSKPDAVPRPTQAGQGCGMQVSGQRVEILTVQELLNPEQYLHDSAVNRAHHRLAASIR